MNYKALYQTLVNGLLPVVIGLGLATIIINSPIWVLNSLFAVGYSVFLYYLYRQYDKQSKNYEE